MIINIKPEFKFIIQFTSFTIIWFFFYHYLYKIDNLFNLEINLLTTFSRILSYQSNLLLSLLDFKTTTEVQGSMVITKILDYPYSHGVWIGEPCNGIKVFGIFSIFIVSFKGKILNKIWFILLGILILHIINIFRIALLTYISAVNPYILNFNHNITFQLIVYLSMLGLWYLWIIKLSKFNDAKS